MMMNEIKMVKDLFYGNKGFATDFDEYENWIEAKMIDADVDEEEKETIVLETLFIIKYLDYAEQFYIKAQRIYKIYDYSTGEYIGCRECKDGFGYCFGFDNIESVKDLVINNILPMVRKD